MNPYVINSILEYIPNTFFFDRVEDKELAIQLMKEQNSIPSLSVLHERGHNVLDELVRQVVEAKDFNTIANVLDYNTAVLIEAVRTKSTVVMNYMIGAMVMAGEMQSFVRTLLYSTALYDSEQLGERRDSLFNVTNTKIYRTAIWIAFGTGKPDIEELLIYGVGFKLLEPLLTDGDLEELVYLVEQYNREDIFQYLTEKGIEFNGRIATLLISGSVEDIREEEAYSVAKLAYDKSYHNLFNDILKTFDSNMLAREAVEDDNSFILIFVMKDVSDPQSIYDIARSEDVKDIVRDYISLE